MNKEREFEVGDLVVNTNMEIILKVTTVGKIIKIDENGLTLTVELNNIVYPKTEKKYFRFATEKEHREYKLKKLKKIFKK